MIGKGLIEAITYLVDLKTVEQQVKGLGLDTRVLGNSVEFLEVDIFRTRVSHVSLSILDRCITLMVVK